MNRVVWWKETSTFLLLICIYWLSWQSDIGKSTSHFCPTHVSYDGNTVLTELARAFLVLGQGEEISPRDIMHRFHTGTKRLDKIGSWYCDAVGPSTCKDLSS